VAAHLDRKPSAGTGSISSSGWAKHWRVTPAISSRTRATSTRSSRRLNVLRLSVRRVGDRACLPVR